MTESTARAADKKDEHDMTSEDATLEDEYDEYEEDEDGTLSGFSVLMIGLAMFGAFMAITWIAYQQGLKRGENGLVAETPYVAADPEPIKIETADADEPVEDREVYDVYDGAGDAPVTIAQTETEEPVERTADDPIGALAAGASGGEPIVGGDDAVFDDDADDEEPVRAASLAEENAPASSAPTTPTRAGANGATEPTPAAARREPASSSASGAATSQPAASTARAASAASSASGDALAGSHVVQVGAFRSDEEATAQWRKLQSGLGDFVNGKTYDIERADLGERGVYHRLRIGPFSGADAAKTYCEGLKERGQDCLIKGV